MTKCKECGQSIQEKSLEEKFQDRCINTMIWSQAKILAQTAKEHYQKKFDEICKAGKILKVDGHGVLDIILRLRENMFGDKNE